MRDHVRDLTVNRYGDEIELSVFRFSWDEMPMENVRKSARPGAETRRKMEQNAEAWMKWVIAVMDELSTPGTRELVGTTHAYSVRGLYMNARNCERLSKRIHPMDWLNYSPVQIDDLEDDEFGIDLANMLTRKN